MIVINCFQKKGGSIFPGRLRGFDDILLRTYGLVNGVHLYDVYAL